ncbi:MAG: OB-fold nucleic acid binding domain-containing protein, partial [Patescibacteria group bacterium]|nr:OB-fold nucleic acid binding domain-containing protein [Patescibacteria group bacterium]
MTELEPIRRQKLDALRQKGINAYPAKIKRDHTCHLAKENFDKLSETKKEITLAGRLVLLRLHGGASFAQLQDGTDKIQILFRRDIVGEENYKLLKDSIDLGDFIEATGTLFLTKTNEQTLEVKSFRLITKTLLPLPEKWHGLVDVEVRFRQRSLDLISNPEVRQLFRNRSLIV